MIIIPPDFLLQVNIEKGDGLPHCLGEILGNIVIITFIGVEIDDLPMLPAEFCQPNGEFYRNIIVCSAMV